MEFIVSDLTAYSKEEVQWLFLQFWLCVCVVPVKAITPGNEKTQTVPKPSQKKPQTLNPLKIPC